MSKLELLGKVKKINTCILLALALTCLFGGQNLFALTQVQFDAIRAQYPDLQIAANMSSYYIQEPVATETGIRTALNNTVTTMPNLIVVSSTIPIVLSSSTLSIPNRGANGVIIVPYAGGSLTVDGNNKFSAFTVNGGTVKMGGITVTNCINSGISASNGSMSSTFLTITKCKIWKNTGLYGGGIGGNYLTDPSGASWF